ncbi:MAG: hypothetical protein QOK37_1391 [Thermoanaerobaculia bacterium]|jgi:hypothetical protein|nr:hypothetical protein [Thermoanaerobaculia bacterium]
MSFFHAIMRINRGKVLFDRSRLRNPSNPEGKDGKYPIAGRSPASPRMRTRFAASLKSRKIAFREMKPGEMLTYVGKKLR